MGQQGGGVGAGEWGAAGHTLHNDNNNTRLTSGDLPPKQSHVGLTRRRRSLLVNPLLLLVTSMQLCVSWARSLT